MINWEKKGDEDFLKRELRYVSQTLAEVGIDLTYEALNGKIEEIYEREKETQKVIEILGSRTSANPMIVGEAGVGKTAIAKNLANLIVKNKVPDWLRNWKIVLTSFPIICGVASSKTSDDAWPKYWGILREVIEICKRYPIILFMDEMEFIADFPVSRTIILPALSEGSLKLIGTMTERDYRNIIEKDSTLNRRFQPVYLEPLSSEATFKILKNLKKKLEEYYQLEIKDDILRDIIEFSDIYIHLRFQPAKAIDVLEKACTKAKYENAKELNIDHVKLVISETTKIPFEIITTDVKEKYKGIGDFLKKKIIGQDEIIDKIVERLLITFTRSNLELYRPKGVFLFAGPTGVGKTELAKALSMFLTGSEENMVRLDMSLYQNPVSIHDLLGTTKLTRSPEGAGVPLLTNILRTHPFTVLLLDEFEKACPEIWNLFLQVFDYGILTDLDGNKIYFDNSIIIMTTNVGFKEFSRKISLRPGDKSSDIKKDVEKAINDTFPRELLGRIDEILIFNPLTKELMKKFVLQKVDLLKEKNKKEIKLSEKLIEFLAEAGYDEKYGARGLNRVIEKYLGRKIAELKLTDKWNEIKEITFDIENEQVIIK